MTQNKINPELKYKILKESRLGNIAREFIFFILFGIVFELSSLFNFLYLEVTSGILFFLIFLAIMVYIFVFPIKKEQEKEYRRQLNLIKEKE